MLNNWDDIEISSPYLKEEGQLAFHFSFPYFTNQNKIEDLTVCFVRKDSVRFSFIELDFEQLVPDDQKQFDNIKVVPFAVDSQERNQL